MLIMMEPNVYVREAILVNKRKGVWFSFVITRKTLVAIFVVISIMIVSLTTAALYEPFARRIYGVKPGVTLEVYDMSGLLPDELFDAILSIGEDRVIEAKNASFDWQTELVYPEQVGMIIDVSATIEALLSAEPGSSIELAHIQVLPSVTQSHFVPYYQGPTDEPKVSLMINVDWGNEYIPTILDIFAQYNITTTWFPTGSWVAKFPELARLIADAGHEIGNHGGWHGMPSQMTADEVRELILDGEEKIINVTGQKPRVFAPPAGDMNKQTVAIAGELGYKTVLWTVDTVDWQRPAPTVIIDRVMSKIQNGALVLMHPTEPTAAALPIIIEQLQAKGYQVVTVSELLGP